MSHNLRGNDIWALWRWKMDSLFASWPLIVIATHGQRMVLQACWAATAGAAVNDNEVTQ